MNDLQTLANGDTNYISKHNANYANLKSAVDAIENNLAGQVAAASGPGAAFIALFGPTASIVGADSYALTGSGDARAQRGAGRAFLHRSGGSDVLCLRRQYWRAGAQHDQRN
jgi:hypothetical protein